MTSPAKPSSDLSHPTPLTLGAVVHGRVDPGSRTSQVHYWLVDLPAGKYKAVVDMARSDQDSANIQADVSWLNPDGEDPKSLGHFNDIDYRARHVFPFALEAPRKGIICVKSQAMMDYDLGLFEATATVTVPFFYHTPKVTPIRLEQTVSSPPLDGASWKANSAYYSLTLPAGDYKVSVDLRRLDGQESNLMAAVLTLNADGAITGGLGTFNEITSRAVKSFPLALSEEQFLILRISGKDVEAAVKVEPVRDE